jgi:DNA-binding NtrC family response regulator
VRGNRLAASRILRISYKTMLNKITEHGLTRKNAGAKLDAK